VNALLVAVGGAAGSVLRYWMSGATQRLVPSTGDWSLFPLGTLAVNVAGCVIAGALAEIGERHGPLSNETRALLMVGFLGGFTTFSAFANETVAVWRSDAAAVSLVNIVSSVALCLIAVVVGRGLVAAIAK
jgi:fluoride exporter